MRGRWGEGEKPVKMFKLNGQRPQLNKCNAMHGQNSHVRRENARNMTNQDKLKMACTPLSTLAAGKIGRRMRKQKTNRQTDARRPTSIEEEATEGKT